MKPPESSGVTIEKSLYLLAFLLALGLRLLNLDASPLSDFEASFALQAHGLEQYQLQYVSPQPAYVILTSLVFNIFKESESTARLVPAIAGSFLVFLPLLLSSRFHPSLLLRQAGVILAFGLALDPALVALSRMAGGPMLAMVFLFMAAGFAWRGSAAGTGILGMLALLSGPGLITGLLGWGLAGSGIWILSRQDNNHFSEFIPPSVDTWSRQFWVRSLYFAAGTFLIVGLLWLTLPQGLAGLASLLPTYLIGWTRSSGVPALRLPAAILLYQPLLVGLPLAALVRTLFRSGETRQLVDYFSIPLSAWALGALLPGLLYPSRQVFDASWAVIPLWILVALELSRLTLRNLDRNLRLTSLGLAGIFTLFMILIWYNLLRLGNLQAQAILYVAIIGGLVLMVLIVFILVSLGWNPSVAFTGLGWGFTLVSGFTMLAAMWGMSQVRMNQPAELWTVEPGTGQTIELIDTLNGFSQWQTGLRQAVEIIATVDSPALRWATRDFYNTSYVRSIPPTQQPAIMLTPSMETQPRLASSYRGQELIWSRTQSWNGIFPPNLLRWLTFREMPTASESIIIWVRNDLFIGEDISDTNFETLP